MRLSADLSVGTTDPSEVRIDPHEILVLLRHGETRPFDYHDSDPGLVAEALKNLSVLGDELTQFIVSVSAHRLKGIKIYHCPNRRSSESLKIIIQPLIEEMMESIRSIEMIQTRDLESMLKGEPSKKWKRAEWQKIVADGKDAFEKELREGNLSYSFGDPILDPATGNAKYPELVGAFAVPGEDGLSISIRYYELLRDILQRSRRSLGIIVGQNVSCTRFDKVMYALRAAVSKPRLVARPGDLLKIELEVERPTLKTGTGMVVRKPALGPALRLLVREIKFLKEKRRRDSGK